MPWPVASRRCTHAARLSVLVAIIGAALVLPVAASAATNPGTVELFQSSLNYTARAGEANVVAVDFESDQVTLTDTAATLNAGAGCSPGASVRQVICTTDDAGTSAFSFLQYAIDTGDLADQVTITTPSADVGSGFSFSSSLSVYGAIRGGAGADTLTGGDGFGQDVLFGGPGADTLNGGGGEQDAVSYIDHAAGVTATIGGSGGNAEDGAGDTIAGDVENLSGGPGADTLTGDGGRNSLRGAGGADALAGMGGSDDLAGGSYGFFLGLEFPDDTDPPATADGNDTLNGGTGADVLRGDAGADVLAGGSGEDTANFSDHGPAGLTATVGGTGGDATDGAGDTIPADVENLSGGPGPDVLNGDGGPNRLDGGQGADTLNGNGDADVLLPGSEGFEGAASSDTANGGDGNDVYDAGSGFGNTSDGPDTFNGGDGIDRADYSSRGPAVTVTLNDDLANDGQAGEQDHISSDVENASGGSGADTLTGDDGDNRLHGGFGADTIKGGPGNDRIFGGYGYGTDDVDSLEGEDGNDTLYARDGIVDSKVDCGPGDDLVEADDIPSDAPVSCETVLEPAPGGGPTPAGEVSSNASGFSYTAVAGETNVVTATFSADQIVLTDTGAAALTAGQGCELTAPGTVRCGRDDTGFSSANYAIRAGDGNDRVEIVNGADGFGQIDGGAGDDVLTGGDGSDLVLGGGGADVLAGGEGTDTVTYVDHTAAVTATIGGTATSTEDGAGDSVSADVENLTGGAGDDTLTGNGAANSLIGAQGDDGVSGLGGNDDLNGGGFAPIGIGISGPDGADALSGGSGNDVMTGGAGADALDGGSGSDTADYGDHGAPSFSFDPVFHTVPGEPVTVTLGAGAGDDGNADDGAAGSRDTVALDVENLTGTQSGDTLTGSPVGNRIDGGGGTDTIMGLGGNDVLRGGFDEAADALDGGDGADTYVAEGFRNFFVNPNASLPDGADTFTGGAGIDKADYSARSAAAVVTVTLDGSANDGQAGENDDIKADVENVTGGNGNDSLTGNDAANRLHGGPGTGDDTLDGAGGDDRIIGGDGAYAGFGLTPGDGVDTLRGGSGQDTISSKDGRVDTVDCGTEIDVANADDGTPPFEGAPATATDALTGCENVNPAGFSQAVSPGGTVSSDSQPGETPGVSSTDPVDVAITSPNGGNVTVAESEITGSQPPAGSDYLALQVNITAPVATEADPLRLVFTIDASIVPAGGAAAIKVFRDGTELDSPCPTPTTASANGCILSRTTDGAGDVTLTILTAHASAWNFAVPKTVVTPPAGGGGAATTTPPATTPPAAIAPPAVKPNVLDTVRPVLTFSIAASAKVRNVIAKKGLLAKFACSEACTVTANLRLSAKDAKRLGLPKLIGRATKKLAAGGSSSVLVALTSRAQKRLRRLAGKVVVSLTLTAQDVAGNAATAPVRKITLKR
jgi:Ca2+-binding RTX toxin-like protein